MLTAPDIEASLLAQSVADAFEFSDIRVKFLPLGVDARSASYEVKTAGEKLFLKLRLGEWYPPAVDIPLLLSRRPGTAIIAPIQTATGETSFAVGCSRAVLYPFISGCNAYERSIDADGWRTIACTLNELHRVEPGAARGMSMRVERFSAYYRRATTALMADLPRRMPLDEIDHATTELLRTNATTVKGLVERTEEIARRMREVGDEHFVPCHADLHAGNIHIGEGGNHYIVDWDELILAPHERDLMYVGGGLLSSGLTPSDEAEKFYSGYSGGFPDRQLVLYYRIERIIADIVEFVRAIRETRTVEADRKQSLIYLGANFSPGGTIDMLSAGA